MDDTIVRSETVVGLGKRYDEGSMVKSKAEKIYANNKLYYNEGTKRICNVCLEEYYGTSNCERCVQNYLKANFSSWTSGNNDIDNLIQKCQMGTVAPNRIIEWIPYNNLQDIKYLTKGGCSEIYIANWVGGSYNKWNVEKQELQRYGTREVILKKSKKFQGVNQSWIEEVKSLLYLSNKWKTIVKCYGITQDPKTENYFLVMKQMDVDLRRYLQHRHNSLTWRERINIVYIIIYALYIIHKEDAIHGDLHSGNVLYKKYYDSRDSWYISDLAFRGPANKPSESVYGNLPYIAPEVISEKEYTKASDIYSIAMIMWEISSGQPPFNNYEHDSDVTMKIINGIRPKIVPETPLEYISLMQQCWDANPLNRPDGNTLKSKIEELRTSYCQNEEQKINNQELKDLDIPQFYPNDSQISNATSKIYIFKNLPKPKNASEIEQDLQDGGENIYNNPNLHSEDQDELEIPEFDDINELYNKGINEEPNMESDNAQLVPKINIEDETSLKVPEDVEKKSKNKKSFIKGSINKISKISSKILKPNSDKKEKKYD